MKHSLMQLYAYVDIAKTCLAVFPPEEDILPENTQQWQLNGQTLLQKQTKMSVQFSAADSLSKDPL